MPKNKPGGQPRNQNARTHGFYSTIGSPSLKNHLRRARRLHDQHSMLHEVQLARAFLAEMMDLDPSNGTILTKVLNSLTRMIALDYGLTRNEEGELGAAMAAMLQEVLAPEEDN